MLANDAVDLEVRGGEVHALLGENGAGKSTLSNVLTGLYRPDAGTIRLWGELVELTSALHALAHEPESRTQFVKDAGAYADKYRLSSEQRQALIALDLPMLTKLGTHPLVPFLANMHIQRMRAAR